VSGPPADVAVRRAGPGDVQAWARFRVAMHEAMGLTDPLRPAAVVEAAIAAWLRERLDSAAFAAYVAEIDGQPVGSGGITIYDVPPGPGGPHTLEAYVMSMYTLPTHRGRGVAGAVLDEMIDFARAAGAGLVWLRASAMGRPVYVRAGFEPRDSYLALRLRDP
jgi:GNAT superfamily N-acetyltransferase